MKLGIIFAALLVGLVAFGQPAVAAKPVPTGTIAIAAGSDLNLGGWVSFDWTVDNLGGNNPRIQVVCTQTSAVTPENPDGIVYGEAHNATPKLGDPPFDGASFLLGGAGSLWLTNGGPAECTAILYYWQFSPSQVFHPLAEVSFAAGG